MFKYTALTLAALLLTGTAVMAQSTTYTRLGGTVFGSDGTTATRLGNSTFINQPGGQARVCTTLGASTFCN